MVFGCAWAFGIAAVIKAQPGSETALHEVKNQKTPEQIVANYEKHIRPVFEAKCAQCHTSMESRPFVYHIPLVSVFSKPYIDDIIRAGRVEWEFTKGFPSERTGSSMEFLLKVHDTVQAGTMPIESFRYLRPWTTLSKGEEELLTTWAETGFKVFEPQLASAGRTTLGQADAHALAKAMAENLAQACPIADPQDQEAHVQCAAQLGSLEVLHGNMRDPLLWGQQKKAGDYVLEHHGTTRFDPMAWSKLYLSLFMFNGQYKVEPLAEGAAAIRMPVSFRGNLDAGDYPYPFWHAEKKWQAYHTCADLVFIFKNHQIVGALRSAENKAERVAIREVKWDKKWTWTDEKTHTEQPHVALYTNLFSAGNPYTAQLDGAFRNLAKGLQKAECLDCHRPDNQAQMKMLEMLNYPNQALSGRGRILEVLQQNAMPPGDGLKNDDERKSLLAFATEFKRLGDAAFQFETAKTQTAK